MDGEDMKDYREAQQQRRAIRLPIRTEIINRLISEGYKVEWKTDYQCRINDILDLYPIHHRFHNIKTNKRGGYKHVHLIVEKTFKTK